MRKWYCKRASSLIETVEELQRNLLLKLHDFQAYYQAIMGQNSISYKAWTEIDFFLFMVFNKMPTDKHDDNQKKSMDYNRRFSIAS